MLVAQGVGWELGRQAPPPWVGPLCQAVALTAGLAAAKDADVGALAPAFGAVWLGSLMLPAVLFVTVAAGRPPRPLRRLLLGAVVITAGLALPLPPAAQGTAAGPGPPGGASGNPPGAGPPP